MNALESLLFGHPTASLLILAACVIWLAIYAATINMAEQDVPRRYATTLVRSDPASDDKKYDAR